MAESTRVTGAGNASAKVNFQIVLGHTLFLAVGTGSVAGPLATDPTVDTVTFDYSAAANLVGTGAAAPTITGNAVTTRVYGNRGQITLTASHPANLVSGTNTIAFTQITVTSNNFFFPAPAMGGAAVFPWTNFFGLSQITDRTAIWTFQYSNSVPAAGGLYTGQVTYTASML